MDEVIRYKRGTLSPDQLRTELIDFIEATKTDPSLEQQVVGVGVPASDIDQQVRGIAVETDQGLTEQDVQIIIAGAQLAIKLWTDVIYPWIRRRRTHDAIGERID